MRPEVTASDRETWRAWLEKNHASAKEVWLVYYKKHTGKASVSYRESVEEALCFGWIDGIRKRVDDECYMHRFTPRRKGSKWSSLNIRLATEMIEAGQMSKAGLDTFKNRVEHDGESTKTTGVQDVSLAAETEEGLKANKKAWENFGKLAPGYRKQYIGWLQSAKKPETRERRLKELIRVLEQNKKLGMK